MLADSPRNVAPALASALAFTGGQCSAPLLQSTTTATAAATVAVHSATECPGSRVATVILPHDVSWASAPPELLAAASTVTSTPRPAAAAVALATGSTTSHAASTPCLADRPAAMKFLQQCAAALAAAPRGSAALLLGGQALLEDGVCTFATASQNDSPACWCTVHACPQSAPAIVLTKPCATLHSPPHATLTDDDSQRRRNPGCRAHCSCSWRRSTVRGTAATC